MAKLRQVKIIPFAVNASCFKYEDEVKTSFKIEA